MDDESLLKLMFDRLAPTKTTPPPFPALPLAPPQLKPCNCVVPHKIVVKLRVILFYFFCYFFIHNRLIKFLNVIYLSLFLFYHSLVTESRYE